MPRQRQQPKLRADIDRAMLVSQHKPQVYTMLSDESDDSSNVAAARQVTVDYRTLLTVSVN